MLFGCLPRDFERTVESIPSESETSLPTSSQEHTTKTHDMGRRWKAMEGEKTGRKIEREREREGESNRRVSSLLTHRCLLVNALSCFSCSSCFLNQNVTALKQSYLKSTRHISIDLYIHIYIYTFLDTNHFQHLPTAW